MIRPAVVGSRLGFICERSEPRTGNLIKDILNELNGADVVIADLTDTNPNVFYELGVRHTLRNRTILIAQDMEFVPSDLKSYWVIIYKKDLSGLQDFKDKMKDTLREMMRDPEKPDNPVADFLGEKNVSLLSQERSANLKKLTALVSEFSDNLGSADEILSLIKTIQKKGKKKERLVSNIRLANTCLTELLSTRYIELPKADLELLTRVNRMMLSYNSMLNLWPHESFSASVVEMLGNNLPWFRGKLAEFVSMLNRIRLEYMSDNYQEEATPVLLLSSEEHQKYLETT